MRTLDLGIGEGYYKITGFRQFKLGENREVMSRTDGARKILVVDNYDSFVFNLVQYLGQIGASCTVLRNDEVKPEDAKNFDGVLISPGPGTPEEAGVSIAMVKYCAQEKIPLFGVCLGHQAIGVAFGAMAAARRVPLKKSLTVMPLGFAMGIIVIIMVMVTNVSFAYPLLVLIGALSGYFVVPMNALLQHRGHVLMSAGHSIAVQNFNENLCILIMLGLYAFLISHDVHINWIVLAFGLFVAGAMLLVKKRHEANQAEHDSLHLIGIEKH